MNETSKNPYVTALINLTDSEAVAVIVWFALAILLALIIHKVAFVIFRNILRHSEAGRRIVDRLFQLSRFASILIALAMALPAVQFESTVSGTVRQWLGIGITILLGWAAVEMVRTAADLILRDHKITNEDNLQKRRLHTQVRVLQRVAIVIVTLVTAGVILMSFPSIRAVGFSLFASAGVAGIVLGFAARPILGNLIAGVQIALTQPIRIDDVLFVEGEWSWVEEITATYVVLRIWDLRRLVVPLTYFIEKPFQNWTRESAAILGTVTWHLDYRVPVAAIREKFDELVKAHPLWDGSVANIQVTEANVSSIKVRALVSARNSSQAWDLRCDIREKIIAWLQDDHPDVLPRVRAEIEVTDKPDQL